MNLANPLWCTPSLSVHRSFLALRPRRGVGPFSFSPRNRESKWTVARGVHPSSKYTPTRRKRTGLEERKRDLLKRTPVVLENEIASHDFFLPIRDPHATIPGKFFLPVGHVSCSKKKIKPKPKFQRKCLFC